MTLSPEEHSFLDNSVKALMDASQVERALSSAKSDMVITGCL